MLRMRAGAWNTERFWDCLNESGVVTRAAQHRLECRARYRATLAGQAGRIGLQREKNPRARRGFLVFKSGLLPKLILQKGQYLVVKIDPIFQFSKAMPLVFL